MVMIPKTWREQSKRQRKGWAYGRLQLMLTFATSLIVDVDFCYKVSVFFALFLPVLGCLWGTEGTSGSCATLQVVGINPAIVVVSWWWLLLRGFRVIYSLPPGFGLFWRAFSMNLNFGFFRPFSQIRSQCLRICFYSNFMLKGLLPLDVLDLF